MNDQPWDNPYTYALQNIESGIPFYDVVRSLGLHTLMKATNDIFQFAHSANITIEFVGGIATTSNGYNETVYMQAITWKKTLTYHDRLLNE